MNRDIVPIASAAHPLVKLALALKSAHGRKKHGLLLLEGLRAIEAALAADFSGRAALITAAALNSRAGRLLASRLNASEIPVYSVPERVYERITAVEAPQGTALICATPRLKLAECLKGDWLVVADRVQDPGNLGAILRSARAFGANGLLTTAGTCEIANPKTLRAAAGAWPGIATVEGVGPARILEGLVGSGHRILVSSSQGGRDFRSVNWHGRVALVLGNESRGAAECFFTKPATGVRIFHLSCVESLNVGMAASILLAEGFRARRGDSSLNRSDVSQWGK